VGMAGRIMRSPFRKRKRPEGEPECRFASQALYVHSLKLKEKVRKDWPLRRPRFAYFLLLLLSMDFSLNYYARTGRRGGRASRRFYCYFLVWTFRRNTTQGLAVQAMALRALLATTSKYGLFVELIRKLREKSCAME